MTRFTLKCGAVVLIDDVDLPLLTNYHWNLSHYGYVVRYEGSSRNKTQRTIFLHHTILQTSGRIDHKNRNKLDNQRKNLRPATGAQNAQNRAKFNGTSRFKGVFWFKRDSRWAAQVKINGRSTHLGYFVDEVKAARAYDQAALLHFGEFARINDV